MERQWYLVGTVYSYNNFQPRILFLQQMILRNPFNEETNFYLK
jgi:hypothetical protein